MIILFFVLALALDKDEGCRVACIRSQKDGGEYYKSGCKCYVYEENYDAFIHNRIIIGDLHSIESEPDQPEEKKKSYYEF